MLSRDVDDGCLSPTCPIWYVPPLERREGEERPMAPSMAPRCLVSRGLHRLASLRAKSHARVSACVYRIIIDVTVRRGPAPAKRRRSRFAVGPGPVRDTARSEARTRGRRGAAGAGAGVDGRFRIARQTPIVPTHRASCRSCRCSFRPVPRRAIVYVRGACPTYYLPTTPRGRAAAPGFDSRLSSRSGGDGGRKAIRRPGRGPPFPAYPTNMGSG